jgi:sodium transport system permease protein
MLRVRDALALYALAVAGLILVGGALASGGYLGLAASEVLIVAAPVALVARARGDRLGLVRPSARALIGGALVGVSAWAVLTVFVLPLQEKIAPTPKALEEALTHVVSGATWAVLLVVAVLPALCEELLLRGALTLSLRRALGATPTVVVSAVLFAILHGSAYRLLPTFLLGVAFAVMALRAGSIVPGMLAHALSLTTRSS